MPKEHLDKDRIIEFLAEAGTKWYSNHSGEFKYREHLEFTADYIVRNYRKETRYAKQSGDHKR